MKVFPRRRHAHAHGHPLGRAVTRAGRGLAVAWTACALAMASGCAALVVGGAVGTAFSATDRRTTGTQLEDQLIDLKARNRVREVLPDRGNVNATSYNRILLLTGEVPTEADKVAVEATVSKIDALKGLVNDLAVRQATDFSSRTNDTVLTSKVKATFVDARAFPPNVVKVVTERSIVYLMGRATDAEADKAAELARGVPGVMKVVKVFDPITQAEIDALPKTGGPEEKQ